MWYQNEDQNQNETDESSSSSCDELEQDIANILQQTNDDDNEHSINCGDTILKLALVVGDKDIGADESIAFNNMLARMVMGQCIQQNDVTIFRAFLTSVNHALRAAMSTPLSENAAPDAEPALNMAKLTLLRTARRCLAKGRDTSCEYALKKDCTATDLSVAMGGKEISEDCSMAYNVIEQMHLNAVTGMNELDRVSKDDDNSILCFLKNGQNNLSGYMFTSAFASLFDGQRLRAGNSIAASHFGDGGGVKAYNEESMASVIFTQNATKWSVLRMQVAFSVIIALARKYILDEYVTVGAMSNVDDMQCKREARKSEYWKATVDLQNNMREKLKDKVDDHNKHKHAPASFVACVGVVVDWLESAVCNEFMFGVIRAAFSASYITLGNASDAVRRQFAVHVEETKKNTLCLFGAAEFLCRARHAIDGSTMSLSNAMLCVLSGVVGNAMEQGETPIIDGPFVLTADAKVHAKQVLSAIYPSNIGRVIRYSENCGSSCGRTELFDSMLTTGTTRKKNKVSKLVEARLSACLVVLSTKESLMRDLLCSDVSTSAGCGRKDVRRMHITTLKTLPGLKRSEARHDGDGASYLVERERSDSSRTQVSVSAGDFVEKPWRDVSGVAIANTLLFNIAGPAFLITLQDMEQKADSRMQELFGTTSSSLGALHRTHGDDESVHGMKRKLKEDSFRSNTDTCVNAFLDNLLRISESKYFPATVLPDHDSRVREFKAAKMILLFGRAFVRAYARVARDNGWLWEGLTQTFCIPVEKNKSDRCARPEKTRRLESSSPSFMHEYANGVPV